jgi:hypothetical protein
LTIGTLVLAGRSAADSDDKASRPQSHEPEVRRLCVPVATLRTQADPNDSASLHRLLIGAIKRQGRQPSEVDDFEMIVRVAGDRAVLATYVAAAP